MKPFFTATLTNDTPVFLGGYDTQYARDGITEGLRTQSLKGLIRYWMRVYLASYYSDGKINDYISNILGGNINGKLKTSRVRLTCHTLNDTVKSFDNMLKDVPRVKLLTLGKHRLPNFADKIEARIELYSTNNNLDDKDKRLVIGSLITGLLLSGLGKMGRRGFGCFRINIEEGEAEFKTSINKLFSSTDVDTKVESIKNIITYTKNSIKKENSKAQSNIHSFDNCKILYIPLKRQELQELAFFQRFTVRGSRAIEFGENPRHYKDDITKKHLAWFMGLPRNQKGTGYFVNGEGRRASAMFISIHKGFALVSFFKSMDWYENITWKGGHGKKLTFKPKQNIDDAFNTTIDLFKRYMSIKGYEVKEV